MTKGHPYQEQPVSVGPLTAIQSAQLMHLATNRRVFNRLDWWTLSEWALSDAFTHIISADRINAALLAVSVSFVDIHDIHSSRSHSAWLRWCAVKDGVSATRALKTLFDFGDLLWLDAGITDTFCIVEPGHWFSHYLRENGYRRVDEVITMIFRGHIISGLPGKPIDDLNIRTALTSDLRAICAVDRHAFDEQWRYPAFALERALQTSAYSSVAVHEEKIVAYQMTSLNENSTHISRLAVHPALQGRGIGATMLSDAIATMQDKYGVNSFTLNTQASNLTSQRLYGRFGFVALQPRIQVLHKTHAV